MRNEVFQFRPAQALSAAREHLDWARTKILLSIMGRRVARLFHRGGIASCTR